jgi:hypothetical protein
MLRQRRQTKIESSCLLLCLGIKLRIGRHAQRFLEVFGLIWKSGGYREALDVNNVYAMLVNYCIRR